MAGNIAGIDDAGRYRCFWRGDIAQKGLMRARGVVVYNTILPDSSRVLLVKYLALAEFSPAFAVKDLALLRTRARVTGWEYKLNQEVGAKTVCEVPKERFAKYRGF
jgi:hypothetical protein